MGDYFDWINSLCHRFHYLTQVYMGKPFYYDLDMAYNASKHSEYMAQKKSLEHSNCVENICSVPLICGDERALHEAIRTLKVDDCHRKNMENSSTIGIGIALDRENNVLYITQRLR